MATQGKFRMPSRCYVTGTVLPKKFVKLQCEVKLSLKDAQFVSLSTDSWTSRCTDNFTAATAHLLDSNMQLKCYMLLTSESSESHTSENIAKFLKDVLDAHEPLWQYAIYNYNRQCGQHHQGSEGSRNDRHPVSLNKQIAKSILFLFQFSWSNINSYSLLSHWCFAHTLNLATQRAISKCTELSTLMARMRKVVGYFHKSPKAKGTHKYILICQFDG